MVEGTPGDAFVAALHSEARPRFTDPAGLATTLATLYATAAAAYPDLTVAPATFAAELARRLAATASAAQLARTRIDHVYLAIACMGGDERAVQRVEAEFFAEVDNSAYRLRATRSQAEEVRAQLARLLFVSEPGREAGLASFSGRGDLGSYIRVIATRELVRMITKDRRTVAFDNASFLDHLSPVADPELRYLRDHYRADVDAAIRAALAGLDEEARALLRYSVIDGWNVDRIAELYGVHRATAARRVAAAREQLGESIRAELAARLEISTDEVDSIVRLVQSRVDVSLARLLG